MCEVWRALSCRLTEMRGLILPIPEFRVCLLHCTIKYRNVVRTKKKIQYEKVVLNILEPKNPSYKQISGQAQRLYIRKYSSLMFTLQGPHIAAYRKHEQLNHVC